MSAEDPLLYDKLLHITYVYLGPAADRFIDRQVRNHLHKAPDKLSQDDLLQLIDWIRVAVSLLTDDGEAVEEYAARLRQLALNNPKPKRS